MVDKLTRESINVLTGAIIHYRHYESVYQVNICMVKLTILLVDSLNSNICISKLKLLFSYSIICIFTPIALL